MPELPKEIQVGGRVLRFLQLLSWMNGCGQCGVENDGRPTKQERE